MIKIEKYDNLLVVPTEVKQGKSSWYSTHTAATNVTQSREPNLSALNYNTLCNHYQCRLLYKASHFKRRIQYTVAAARFSLFLRLFNHTVAATNVTYH